MFSPKGTFAQIISVLPERFKKICNWEERPHQPPSARTPMRTNQMFFNMFRNGATNMTCLQDQTELRPHEVQYM